MHGALAAFPLNIFMGSAANFLMAVRSIKPMKLVAMGVSATFALACVTGCVTPAPAPRAASTPRQPTVLPDAPQKPCDADTLAHASLWSGTLLARTPTTLPATAQRVVYDRVVRCGGLDLDACRSWAEREVSHVTSASPEAERRVEPGSEARGTMWSLLVDGQREGHLLRTNRDFAQTFRRLAAAGKDVQVTDRQRVVEPRFGRVHMRVLAPAQSVAAERWTLELDASEMAVVELGLALDDLEGTGVRVSDRSELERLGWEITPIARTAFLSTPLREQSTGRKRVEIVVSCDAG